MRLWKPTGARSFETLPFIQYYSRKKQQIRYSYATARQGAACPQPFPGTGGLPPPQPPHPLRGKQERGVWAPSAGTRTDAKRTAVPGSLPERGLALPALPTLPAPAGRDGAKRGAFGTFKPSPCGILPPTPRRVVMEDGTHASWGLVAPAIR